MESETSRTKFQINPKLQEPNFKRFLNFGNWNLFVICYLLFGILLGIALVHSDTLALTREIPLSGQLLTPAKSSVPDGDYTMRFAIYDKDRTASDPYPSDADSASRIWTEMQTVKVERGLWKVVLGTTTALPYTLNFETGTYFLGIRINTDPEMVPRKKILPVPLALNAESLGGAKPGTGSNDILQLDSSGAINIAGNITTAGILQAANVIAGSIDLPADSVLTGDILDGTVSTFDLANGVITTVKISDSSVSSEKIADGAVTSAKVSDGAVSSTKLADAAVTVSKIADGAITTVKLSDGSVVTAKLADLSVTTAKIADTSITAAKLVTGDLHFQNTDIGTTSLSFSLGTSTAVGTNNFSITASSAANKPAVRYNGSTGKWQISNDGTTFADIFSGSISGIASLNGLSGSAQTFANDTNITITSAGTTHTLGWTGTLAVSRGGTGTGTTFTAGSVLFAGASGVYSQDNANFFWDNANARLGIGTVSPAGTLHLAGQGATEAGLYIQHAQSDQWLNPNIITQRSRNTLASPTVVNNGDEVFMLLTEAYDGSDYEPLALISMNVDGVPGLDDMPGNIVFATQSDGSGAWAPPERMRITSGGNVGINTSGGTIVGNLDIRQIANGDQMLYARRNTDTAPTGNLIQFQNAAGTGTLFEISATGKVGINTGSLLGHLDIRQITNGDNIIYSRRNTDTGPTGNFLQFQNAAGSATIFAVDISGNISVGTAGTNIISTDGADWLKFSSWGGSRFVLDSNNGVGGSDTDDFSVYSVNTSGTPLFRIQGAGTNVGNVGIGLSSPTARLHIQGGAATNGTGTLTTSGTTTVTGTGTSFTTELSVGDLIAASGQTRVVASITDNTSLTTSDIFSPNLSGAAFTYKKAIIRLTDGTTATNLILNPQGNPGWRIAAIGGTGLTNPMELRLHNTTDQGSSQIVFEEGGQGNNFTIRYNSAAGGGYNNWLELLGTASSGTNYIFDRDSARFGINSGTSTDPAGNLDIRQYADGDQIIYARRNTDSSPTGNFIQFQNAGGSSTLFAVDVNGNTGIGTGSPTEKLSVLQTAAGTGILGLWDGANNNVLAVADGGNITSKTSAFDLIYTFDGASTYADNTAEAKTSRFNTGNTPFSVLSAEGSSNDEFYLGLDHKFDKIYIDIPTAGAGATLSAQYWNGSWTALTITDGTTNLTGDGLITFTAPSDWATTSVNSNTKYWIRLRSPSTNITIAPLASFVSPSGGNAFQVYGQSGNSYPSLQVDLEGKVLVSLDGNSSTAAICGSQGTGTSGIQNNVRLMDCSGAPAADYAEMYPVAGGIDYGDIVAVGAKMLKTKDGDNIAQLVKSSMPYQSTTIGIVSNNYGDFTSAGYNIRKEDNPMPVALNGRVPVKVSLENGPIASGDPLTSSSTPGVAMKATASGYIIGKALESFTELPPTNYSLPTKILIFVNPGWYSVPTGPLVQGSDSDFNDINIGGLATVKDLVVTGLARIKGDLIVEGKVRGDLDVDGIVKTKGIVGGWRSYENHFLNSKFENDFTVSEGKAAWEYHKINLATDSAAVTEATSAEETALAGGKATLDHTFNFKPADDELGATWRFMVKVAEIRRTIETQNTAEFRFGPYSDEQNYALIQKGTEPNTVKFITCAEGECTVTDNIATNPYLENRNYVIMIKSGEAKLLIDGAAAATHTANIPASSILHFHEDLTATQDAAQSAVLDYLGVIVGRYDAF